MRHKLFFLIPLFILFLASCNHEKEYKVSLEGVTDYLIEDLKESYKEKEEVTIKTSILYDIDLYVYVNGKSITSQVVDNHWEYSFTMPSEDITIVFELSSAMPNQIG